MTNINSLNQYTTLAEACDGLEDKGYVEEFEIVSMTEIELDGKTFRPKDVKIDEFHRFEGITNPSDMSIVYALSTKTGEKGIIIDVFGAESSLDLAEFLRKVDHIAERKG